MLSRKAFGRYWGVMFEILYMLSFTLMRSGAIIGDRLDRGLRSDLPLYPTMLRLITGMAGLVGLCWFIYGFFLFSWWLPLISLLANITGGSLISYPLSRRFGPPLAAMQCSVFGIGLAVIVLVFAS